MNLIDKLTLNKLSKRYKDIKKKSIDAQLAFDDNGGIHGKDADMFKKQLDEANRVEADFLEEYACSVFEILSKTKPMLIRRRDKTEVTWEEAFGDDFSKLSEGLKNSLVALVEHDGGQYVIK